MNALNTNLFDQSYTSPRQTDEFECTYYEVGRVINEIGREKPILYIYIYIFFFTIWV